MHTQTRFVHRSRHPAGAEMAIYTQSRQQRTEKRGRASVRFVKVRRRKDMSQREIKFRAWVTKRSPLGKNYMLYFDLWDIEASEVDAYVKGEKIFSNDPMMQFTGLHDKHGKEIWEGDIVQYWYLLEDGVQKNLGTIEFHMAEFMVKRAEEESYGHISPDLTEVIGNIHEHPHLLPNTPTGEGQ